MEEKKDKKLSLSAFVDKTIEEVCQDMCERYCRFPRELKSIEALENECDLCPLMRL